MEEGLDRWFKEEVLAHEPALRRYILRTWRRPDDLHDLVQEAYARVYQAAQVSRPRSAKAFLFTTTYHLIADRLRRERVVSIEAVADLESLNVSVDEISEERRVSARQELKILSEALDRLPARCREVLWLRRVEALPIKVVAARLGIEVVTVDKHLMRARRLLTEYLSEADAGETNRQNGSPSIEEDESCEQSRD
jgi:RNA polymerase sigma factor (sigma-70 family)